MLNSTIKTDEWTIATESGSLTISVSVARVLLAAIDTYGPEAFADKIRAIAKPQPPKPADPPKPEPPKPAPKSQEPENLPFVSPTDVIVDPTAFMSKEEANDYRNMLETTEVTGDVVIDPRAYMTVQQRFDYTEALARSQHYTPKAPKTEKPLPEYKPQSKPSPKPEAPKPEAPKDTSPVTDKVTPSFTSDPAPTPSADHGTGADKVKAAEQVRDITNERTLEALRARAKELKIKGYALMKKPETLREKIASAEAALKANEEKLANARKDKPTFAPKPDAPTVVASFQNTLADGRVLKTTVMSDGAIRNEWVQVKTKAVA